MRHSFKHLLLAASTAAFTCLPLIAHAGLFSDDEARKAIIELRAKIDTLQTDTGKKADQSSLLSLSDQNDSLRREIADLRGQVEVLANELANTQQRQKDFYLDLDARLRKQEPQTVTVDGKDVSVEPSEQKSYDAALAQFKGGDYKGAISAFSDFVKRHPESGYAAASQYWLGNSYYAQRDYKAAIAAQSLVVKNYPDNPKVPDALLNMASSYAELKDKAATKKTLETLVKKYPDSTAAKTGKDRLSSLK
ncbi:tol-pal system protein YbgF [Herbaspirillum sp. RTI4]|uniref:tol-pal system protein YbgF n=1 Tax=Herbaspirillum sp. RTI4 TaxID=3048640 RepID=UPI002AB55069|nr:tol-pal system protein YbgF [Herbaspirillum sp. RTI4]MDY7580004.1 tol-pal system protein YbgF [Herbaspirillum sp. RTI4]MEA9982818.1 tol-pal system protein YbgF [Herbaspirillum sp. RTI4]